MPTGRMAHQDLMVMLLCRLAWKGCSSETRGMRSASLLETFSVWSDCPPSALKRSHWLPPADVMSHLGGPCTGQPLVIWTIPMSQYKPMLQVQACFCTKALP